MVHSPSSTVPRFEGPTALEETSPRQDWLDALRRYAAVGLVVAGYIGLGFWLRPDTNAYLLLGMPITVAFQVLVARRPLRELWLSRGQALRLDRWTWVVFALLLIGPVQTLVAGVQSGDWAVGVYGAVAMVGAFGAAAALRVLDRTWRRQLFMLVLFAVPIAVGRLLLQELLAGGGLDILFQQLSRRLLVEVQSLLFYVPAVFVVEEVFFRGALDSYLHRSESGFGWASAAYVSILWGLWHAPIVGPLTPTVVATLVGAQLFVGLLLSWAWRRTGNMVVPGTMHAVLDAIRNALLG